jgi:K+-transporting ATPase ATPase A chain
MTANGWLQIVVLCGALLLATRPVGLYLVRVYDGSMHWLGPVERGLYRLAGVDPGEEQHWTRYATSVLLFSVTSMLLTYAALRLQHRLPLNPQGMPAVPDRQAFETAAAFTTNTDWQSYAGESTMSYFSQMTQLAFHNFISAAVGMALAVALVRGSPTARASLGQRLSAEQREPVRLVRSLARGACLLLRAIQQLRRNDTRREERQQH